MSQPVNENDRRSTPGVGRGLDALRESPAFTGPVEPLDDHEPTHDHLALIYESREEQFAAAVPYIRQGLERGERCVYIAHENSRREVAEAMRERGIDVDDAVASGALSIHDERETYLRTGSFDPEDTLSFLDDAITEAAAEYEALRVTGEMSFILEDDAPVDDLLKCESKANYLFRDVDGMALCQYNRERFPPEVVRDVINTHPHLIYNNRVSRNAYYTPPSEFLGSDRPAHEVDRMLGTLHEQTDTKAELEDRQRFVREQTAIIASTDESFEEKLQALFELGCDRFDLELGAQARVDTENDRFEVEYVSGDHEHFEPGVELPLSETYCTAAAEIKAAGSVSNPREQGYDDIVVYREFGIRAYLGTYVEIPGGADRTFFFVASEPREDGFSDDERAFLESMGQWVKYELERRQRERFLRESYEITSDPALSFEEKLEQLLEFGCEWFGLDMAGLNRLPSHDGEFRLEKGVGLGVDPEEETLWTDPDEGCFCRRTVAAETSVSRTDVRGTDWAHDPIHREFGLTSYLGTKVTNGSTPYGTFWFGSTEPRDRPFSDTEHRFVELIGQWISYEIERQDHQQSQQELYEIAADTDRTFEEKLQAVFDLGCEQFDMELGGIAIADPETDRFEVESMNGEHEHLTPGEHYPLSETYCEATVNETSPHAISGPATDDFEGRLCYDRFGVRAYLGMYLELEGAADRTFWFVSTEPRPSGFSETERTFHHLMGQWVKYELERRQRDRTLRERTEHLSALVETTPECIKTVAADGTLLQMNPAGLDMIEADSESTVVGKSVYDLIASEDREAFREFNERVCRGERGTLQFDIVGLEGTRRHMETHAAPLRGPDETISHVALTRDVTEQVARERTLEETIDQLEESNERLESLASMIAHELRNPVTIGQIYSQQLPAETAPNAVAYVEEAFERIENMIDVLLVLTQGREPVGERAPISLADVARDAWDEVNAPDATLAVDLDDEIRADETYLRHLFRNLFENAVQHGDADVVRVGGGPNGFYVADDGSGIPSESRDAVFETGFTTAADEGGTGLGLAFVRELAGVYEWTCAASESADGGARVDFRGVKFVPEG